MLMVVQSLLWRHVTHFSEHGLAFAFIDSSAGNVIRSTRFMKAGVTNKQVEICARSDRASYRLSKHDTTYYYVASRC